MGTAGVGGEPPIFMGIGGEGGTGGEAPCGTVSYEPETLTETRTETQIQTRIETRTETRIETQIQTVTEVRTETVEQLEPVAIYIMVDDSGSMLDGGKWQFTTNALTSFINAPESAGLEVATNYFPAGPFALPKAIDCPGTSLVTPEVDFAQLTVGGAHNQALIDNMLLHGPFGGGTPIEPALRAVTQGCINYEASHAGVDCVALLVTDGEPTTCDQTQQGLTAIAANALTAGVETFTIGMPGADYALLDAIAQAGGTDCVPTGTARACDASTEGQFLDALSLIRDTITTTTQVEVQVEVEVQVPVEVEVEVPVEYEVQVEVPVEVVVPLECEWALPATEEEIDPDKVNLDLTDGASNQTTRLGRVSSAADCLNFTNGWYYDDPAQPTKVFACDDACGLIEALPEARIDLIVGCVSEVALPR